MNENDISGSITTTELVRNLSVVIERVVSDAA